MISHRKVIASVLSLLAALVAIYAGSHFYVERTYPTSMPYLLRNLESPQVVAQQNAVAKAKKAGYSDEEIAKYLSEQNALTSEQLMRNVLLVELTIFSVSFLVALGLLVLIPRIRRPSNEPHA